MADEPLPRQDDVRLPLLVLRCQAGDESAFRQLFDDFGGRTHAHLRSLVGDEADDLQQEVWLTVYRTLASLADPRAFRTWLFRTTRHRAIDHLRRRRRQQELMDEAAVLAPTSVEPQDDAGLGARDDARLEAAIDALPPLQREAVRLRYQDELSYTEIALVAGCPIGTVRTRLHHAKRRLQQLLERGVS
jgi:RNA polymerase sigma-70 factor (ECF subfamily)